MRATAAALGSGTMPASDAQRLAAQLQRRADPPTVASAKVEPSTPAGRAMLAAMGIAVRGV